MTLPTIFALSTAPGRAGIAVIRISGTRSAQVLADMTGDVPAPRRASVRMIRDPRDGAELDQGLVLWFPGPGSFTGEDVAELHIHGGRAVVTGVLEALGEIDGLEPAEPGAFTRRAFENGRMDLTEVEGLADLIEAQTEGQKRQALRQMSGGLGTLYEDWRVRLIRELAYFEAQIDFPDEGDVPADLISASRVRLENLLGEIAGHLDDGHRGERMREGIAIAIAGAPNAGKSSLLNQLARRDAAIVSEHAGTTRDVIEVHLDLDGVAVVVADTAGLRDADSEIEREGIKRARQRIAEADIVLLVIDGSQGEESEGHPVAEDTGVAQMTVVNKIDLCSHDAIDTLRSSVTGQSFAVSATTGEGLDVLVEALESKARDLAGTGEDVVISRMRHRHALEDCRDALGRVLGGDPDYPELAGEDLRVAAHALGRITGRVDVEDLLDVIFADFCIGK